MRILSLVLVLVGCSTTPKTDEEPMDSQTNASVDTLDTEIDDDTDPPVDTDTGTPPPTTDAPALGDLLDHSVNQASAAYVGTVLVMTTDSGGNLPGGFNGSGLGNKAIAGLPIAAATPLSALGPVSIDTLRVVGTDRVYLNIIVDLACDGAQAHILVTEDFQEDAQGDGWVRRTSAPQDASWKVVGTLDTLPGHLETQGATLDATLATYPDACLAVTDTGDGGMPRGQATAPVLVVLGDSGTLGANELHLRRAVAAGTVFE